MRLETERLILRKLEENDVERMFLLDSNSDVMKYIGVEPLTEPDQSREVIKIIQKQYSETGLGYRFLPETWGKGYASEAAKASLEYGFHQIKANIIYAYAHCENEASLHILTKLGFEKTGEFEEPDGICFWYELTLEKYLTKQ